MKEIANYLKSHLREDFNIGVYVYTFFFLTIAIYINYTTHFERILVTRNYGTWLGYINSFLFFAFAYYAVAIPKFLIEKKTNYLKSKEFWFKSILFITLVSLASSSIVDLRKLLFESIDYSNRKEYYYFSKILSNSTKTFLYIIPLFFVKIYFDKKEKNLYGLQLKGFNWKPYFVMLLIMTPLIIAASFQSDFLRTYPTMKPDRISNIGGLDKWVLVSIYEVIYAWDFIFVELIFRGALVIGLARIIGKDAILPMVAMYAFLHFGKPVGETIGSIFGGYILGIIALRSKSIFGGAIIHIGIAMLMEAAAFIQIYLIKG